MSATLNNAEQLRRYLKRIEVEGNIVIRKEVASTIVARCERWIADKNQRNFETINSMSFDQWCDQAEVLDELWELCQQYRKRLDSREKV